MKIKVPIDYLEQGETVYFTVDRLMQVEQITKKSISQLVREHFGMNDLICCLLAGTRHGAKKMRQPIYFQTKIQEAFDNGYSFDELAEPVMNAIIASGVLGKKAVYATFPELVIDELEEKIEEAANEKNDSATQD